MFLKILPNILNLFSVPFNQPTKKDVLQTICNSTMTMESRDYSTSLITNLT